MGVVDEVPAGELEPAEGVVGLAAEELIEVLGVHPGSTLIIATPTAAIAAQRRALGHVVTGPLSQPLQLSSGSTCRHDHHMHNVPPLPTQETGCYRPDMSLWGSHLSQTESQQPTPVGAAVYEVGAAGASLLAAMFRFEDDGRSVTELAQASGVPKATASRTAVRLAEAGLIEDRGSGRERQLVLNRSSPHLAQISELLWLTHGVKLPPEASARRRTSPFERARWTPFAVDGDIARLMPQMLRSEPYSATRELPEESYDGPDVSTARACVLRLQRLRSRIVRFEPWLQTAYYKWSVERDRDLIHLTLHQDAAAAQAQNSLMFSAGDGAREGHVGRLAWAHAIYCLDAEAAWLFGLGRTLEQVSTTSATMQKLRREIELIHERLEAVATREDGSENGSRDDRARRGVQRDLAALQEELMARRAELVAVQEALDGFYRHGGTPGVQEVGTAGERLLSVQASAAARTYAEQVRSMATHASFQTWREQHPQVAQQFPLTSLQQSMASEQS